VNMGEGDRQRDSLCKCPVADDMEEGQDSGFTLSDGSGGGFEEGAGSDHCEGTG
jgi:hypothetical protein